MEKLTELLSNLDLENYCKKLKINLVAIVSKNELCKLKPKTGCYIINLEDSGGNGTHWVSLILFEKISIYFDPFGLIMPSNVIRFCKRYGKKLIYSSDKLQHIDSIYCGWFCLYFLYYLTKNKSKHKSVLLNKHNAIYSEKEEQNDLILKQNISQIFRQKNN
jgi:hypothetical protein